MEADGLSSEFAQLSEDDWSVGVQALADKLGIESGMSVFEVGCGAGAFLYGLASRGCSVGGVDQAPALVARAKQVMPTGSFSIGDAAAFKIEPRADAVVSFGAFMYFRSEAYAEQVVESMCAKARHVMAILDVPDLAEKAKSIAYREHLAGGAEAYASRYEGLEHRYYDRQRLAGLLRANGLVDVRTEDQSIEGYGNARYRFNAWGFVP